MPGHRSVPLSHVAAGTTVCIKELVASPELRDRLRELGLGEEQRIKLLSSEANVICQVCNARLALSEKLAKAILVEPLSPPKHEQFMSDAPQPLSSVAVGTTATVAEIKLPAESRPRLMEMGLLVGSAVQTCSLCAARRPGGNQGPRLQSHVAQA